MTLKSIHGVPDRKRTDVPVGIEGVRLDDVRVFVEIINSGSIRGAALTMRKSPAYLLRRLDVLEHTIRRELFVRTSKGMKLTEDGERLSNVAADFMQHSDDIFDYLSETRQNLRKTIVISVTEGLGTFWLMPRLVEFYQSHPDILIDFRCQMKPARLLENDADICVQLEKPENEDAIVKAIGNLHVLLFASVEYINAHGKPETLAELPDHFLVEQSSHQIDPATIEKYAPEAGQNFISMRTNTSSSHANAIARGAGIGALPSYARAISSRLVAICPEFYMKRDIFLASTISGQKSQHVCKVIDWLTESFDAELYPWFGDNFVHPDDFSFDDRSDNVITMFDSMGDRN